MAEHELAVPIEPSEWFTPPSIFSALGLEFDLDPCSPGPGHWVPAKKIYTKADDGLRQPWHGLIFMNPPFGCRRGQVPWLRKFFAHNNGIAFVAARTSADWFHELVVPNAELLLFPNGKTKFIRPDGSVGKEPGTGIVLIGAGSAACEALLRSGLGGCMSIIKLYDGNLDFERSINACYAEVRARVASGGPPWVPKQTDARATIRRCHTDREFRARVITEARKNND
jgi:hypothetical protein